MLWLLSLSRDRKYTHSWVVCLRLGTYNVTGNIGLHLGNFPNLGIFYIIVCITTALYRYLPESVSGQDCWVLLLLSLSDTRIVGVFRAHGTCLLAANVLFLLNEIYNRSKCGCFWMYCISPCSRLLNSMWLFLLRFIVSWMFWHVVCVCRN